MIISRRHRYIFVHIPKTGGTALSLALEARVGKDDILFGDTPKARARSGRQSQLHAAGRLWKHSTLSDIAGLVTGAELESFFIFTLVRNPWDRLVSYYTWLRTQSFAHPAVTLAQALNFSAFLNHPQTRDSLQRWPASAYMRGADGREHANLYARLEHLSEDLRPLEQHLGFQLGPITPTNQSQRPRDWRGLYSDADAALVAAICAEDIGRFGYRFDAPARPA